MPEQYTTPEKDPLADLWFDPDFFSKQQCQLLYAMARELDTGDILAAHKLHTQLLATTNTTDASNFIGIDFAWDALLERFGISETDVREAIMQAQMPLDREATNGYQTISSPHAGRVEAAMRACGLGGLLAAAHERTFPHHAN